MEEKLSKQKIKNEAANFFKIIFNRIKDEYDLDSLTDVIKNM